MNLYEDEVFNERLLETNAPIMWVLNKKKAKLNITSLYTKKNLLTLYGYLNMHKRSIENFNLLWGFKLEDLKKKKKKQRTYVLSLLILIFF